MLFDLNVFDFAFDQVCVIEGAVGILRTNIEFDGHIVDGAEWNLRNRLRSVFFNIKLGVLTHEVVFLEALAALQLSHVNHLLARG